MSIGHAVTCTEPPLLRLDKDLRCHALLELWCAVNHQPAALKLLAMKDGRDLDRSQERRGQGFSQSTFLMHG